LVIGDLLRNDFSALRGLVIEGLDVVVAKPQAAVGLPLAHNLCVLVQTYADEFSHAELLQLQTKWPLVPLVLVVGAWSEGERRSGRALPGIPRVAWHEWGAYWRAEMASIELGKLPTWMLPATASDEERILAHTHTPSLSGCVVVAADCRDSRRALTDLFREYGCRVIATTAADHCSVADADRVFWDVADARLLSADAVAQLRHRFGNAAITALVTFPRPEDAALARSLGIEQLVGKPYAAETLLSQFGHVRAK
jgi:CheY-like chemotaxis protein